MEIKVDPMQQTVAATTTRQTQNTGEDFKFTLMSSLEEEGLQARPFTHDGRHYDAGEKTGQAHGCA